MRRRHSEEAAITLDPSARLGTWIAAAWKPAAEGRTLFVDAIYEPIPFALRKKRSRGDDGVFLVGVVARNEGWDLGHQGRKETTAVGDSLRGSWGTADQAECHALLEHIQRERVIDAVAADEPVHNFGRADLQSDPGRNAPNLSRRFSPPPLGKKLGVAKLEASQG